MIRNKCLTYLHAKQIVTFLCCSVKQMLDESNPLTKSCRTWPWRTIAQKPYTDHHALSKAGTGEAHGVKDQQQMLVPKVGGTVIAALAVTSVSPGSFLNKVGSGLRLSWPIKMVTHKVYIVSLSD